MKSKLAILILMAGVILMSAGSAHATYTIDGDLSDWGVTPGTDWTPNQGFHYDEDYVGDGGFVNPGWGGQTFDMEAIYTDWDSANLYIALVTGFPINTAGGANSGVRWFSLGDIAIDFGVNGTYDYGIELGSHSNATGYVYDGKNGIPGNIYATNNGNWSQVGGQAQTGSFLTSAPFYMNSSTAGDGSASSWYFINNPTTGHNVVEISIDKSIFGGNWNSYMKLHVTQSCGNDVIEVTTPVPEPMSMVLLGGGLFALLGSRLRKRKK